VDEDVATATGATEGDIEALVVVAEHEHVVGGIGAERVSPHRVRAHRRVGPRVEDRAAVVGPGESVVHVGNDVGELGAGGEVAEAQLVALAAGRVDRVRSDHVRGVELEVADFQEGVARGELVDVEHDLLVAATARSAAVNRVLTALDGPW